MKKVMGFWRCWGLVVGMMIGNGIFMLPAVLAPYGRLSLLGWVVGGIGTIFIALMLGMLTRRKAMLGGPYAYTRAAFGDFSGFLIGWAYWIALLTAIAAGALATTGYIGFFIPGVVENPVISASVSLLFIWLITGINVVGVKTASTFQLITSLIKLLPLFLIVAGGLFIGDVANTTSSITQSEPTYFVLAEIVMIIMWSYLGVECVTCPADDMIEPEKNIPRAMIFGTLTVTAVYILVTYSVMALIPTEDLANSTAPIADAASVIFGPWGAGFIAIGGLISIISAISANVFVVGVMPQALAQDNLVPQKFAQLNKGGAPAIAIIVSGIIASLLIVMNFSEGLMGAFKTLILLSTLATLLPYVGSALAELAMQKRDRKKGIKTNWGSFGIALAALLFTIFALIGSGLMIVLQGTVLLAAGLPLYFWSKRKNAMQESE